MSQYWWRVIFMQITWDVEVYVDLNGCKPLFDTIRSFPTHHLPSPTHQPIPLHDTSLMFRLAVTKSIAPFNSRQVGTKDDKPIHLNFIKC